MAWISTPSLVSAEREVSIFQVNSCANPSVTPAEARHVSLGTGHQLEDGTGLSPKPQYKTVVVNFMCHLDCAPRMFGQTSFWVFL